jgi:hypothetical protein
MMTPAAPRADDEAAPEHPHRSFHVVTAITLAAAGLLSAWATYQAGLWDKKENAARAMSNAQLTEASELMLRAGQEEAMNTIMFLQWMDALAEGQPLRADVLEAHFPRGFATAFSRWRVAQPRDIRQAAPESVLPDFTGPSRGLAQAARARSRQAISEAEASMRVGDSYDIANVVLATSLFLAGIGTALPARQARQLPLILAACLTLAIAVAMVFTPVEVPAWLSLG